MKLKLVVIALILTQIGFAQNFKFGKVSKEELQEKAHPKDPNADAAVLYRSYYTHFEYSTEEGFYHITEVFERIKIYNKQGYDYATKKLNIYQGSGNHNVTFSGLKGTTYNLEGGKVVKTKLGKEGVFTEKTNTFYKQKKFTMPNLKEGCVIEFKYRITSPFNNNIETYRFQEKIPINKVSFLFKSPEYLNYKKHQKGFIPFKVIKDGQERTLDYSYIESAAVSGKGGAPKNIKAQITFRENIEEITMENVPAIIEEANAGNINNYLSGLKYELAYTKYPNSNLKSYATDWNFVAKSIYESKYFGGELEKTKYFKAAIDDLLSGVTSPDEKMMKIFNFVKSKMNWNSIYGIYVSDGVKSAYKDGVGNVAEINLMLTAMFRYANLNANPVLISTKNNGIPVVATRSGFNYVVSAVEVKNGVYLFDATYKESEANILKSELLNWQGRLIREDKSSTWAPLIPSKHAVNNVMINATITNEETKGTVNQRITGHYALEARDVFKNLNTDERRKILEKNANELSNVKITGLNTTGKPVGISYDFESFNIVEEIDGKLYFSPLLFLGHSENPFKMENRNYPIDFEFPKKTRTIINIEIPEGYVVASMPESTSFSFGDNYAVFRYKISNTDTKISLSYEFSINQPLISASDYKNLKGFYQLMVEKNIEKVVLIKK